MTSIVLQLGSRHLLKLLPSHRNWEIRALSSLMLTFQRNRERIFNYRFPKEKRRNGG